MKRIVLDANVLFSNSVRGLFLWMAWRDVCEIVWSKELWEEVFRNYSQDPVKEAAFRQQIEAVVFANFSSFMRTLEPGYPLLGLPDENDEHVVALARQEKVETIVTFNLKDFPDRIVKGIKCVHPDSFLCGLFGTHADEMKTAVREHLQFLANSKPKKADYFESLRRANVKEFAAKLEAEDATDNLFPEVWN